MTFVIVFIKFVNFSIGGILQINVKINYTVILSYFTLNLLAGTSTFSFLFVN